MSSTDLIIPTPKENGGPRVLLNTGRQMPLVGLGTAGLTDPALMDRSVEAALAAGYRQFDTAAVYFTEAQLGSSLKYQLPKFGLSREDIFITTKLHPRIPGMQSVEERVEQSLRDLKTDYIDLVLIHYPCQRAIRADCSAKPDDSSNPESRRRAWLELEKLHHDGKIKTLGVSNYEIRHLEEMQEYTNLIPAVNQCEFHPHFTRRPLRDYCHRQGIFFQAFSSIGNHAPELIHDPVVQEIATKYKISVEVLLLAFATSQGVGVIPMSKSPGHIRENLTCLDVALSNADVARLAACNRDQFYIPTCQPWDVI